jgi:uncharacterized membrane protein YfcA
VTSALTFLLLLLAGFAGGLANALAGGGAFVVFPALLFAGVAPVVANATASLVLLPGGIFAAWVYRHSLVEYSRTTILQLIIICLIGSFAGSLLLLNTGNATFSFLVPWLLLTAAVIFTFAPRLRKAAARGSGHRSLAVLLIGEFIISVYGGYFGAGMGVLMVALFLAAAGMNVHSANGLRTICGTVVNLLAVILFAWKGIVDFKVGIPMLLAGSLAGYFGARVVRSMNEEAVRLGILIYAWGLTAWFFFRTFLLA